MLWALNPYTGECCGERVTAEGRGTTVRDNTDAAFSDDKETIYVATTSGDFSLVNVRKRTLSGQQVFASRSGVEQIIVTSQGLLAAGGDGTVTSFNERLVDCAQLELPGAVRALSFSPDRSELIAGVSL